MEPVPYHEIHRTGAPGVWRPLVGVLALLVGMFVVAPALWQIPFAIGYLVTGQPGLESMTRLLDVHHVTPLGLAYLNLVLASAIPIAWFVQRVVHGLTPGWLASVAPRIRWRFLGLCLLLAAVSLLLTVVVGAVLPGQDPNQVSTHHNPWTPTVRDFVLVVVFLTPLQAAGEEYAFRGYLTQAVGGLTRRRWLAVLVPATLFAIAHGAQSAPVFLDRLGFGILAGILVTVTGGLEAGIALHVLNNFVAYGLALAFGSMSAALSPGEASWWMLVSTLVQMASYLLLAGYAARRLRLRTLTTGGVLEPPAPDVYRFPPAQPPPALGSG